MDIVDFLTKNIWGIIILSVACGVLGSVLGSVVYKYIHNRVLRRKKIKYLAKAGFFFGGGCKTAYARDNTPFHQILLVGDYVIKIVTKIGEILFISFLAIGLLVMLRDYWLSFPIIIGIGCLCANLKYREMRDYINLYQEMVKFTYGDEYFKTEKEGIKQYWDSIS